MSSSRRTKERDLSLSTHQIKIYVRQSARNDLDCIVGLEEANRQLRLDIQPQRFGSCHYSPVPLSPILADPPAKVTQLRTANSRTEPAIARVRDR